MFLKKKKLRYQDLLNDNNTSMNTTQNINRKVPGIEDVKIPIKIQKLLKEISPQIIEEAEPEIIEEVKKQFIKPKTDEEWKAFHKINEEGMKKAYESKEGYYKDLSLIHI